jgi:hypothetical protein
MLCIGLMFQAERKWDVLRGGRSEVANGALQSTLVLSWKYSSAYTSRPQEVSMTSNYFARDLETTHSLASIYNIHGYFLT